MTRLAAALILISAMGSASPAFDEVRQYYDGSYAYSTTNSYYYVRYYYRPTVTYVTYEYHYAIYYPAQPRYVYYYNPTSQAYWGRFDLEGKGGARYSILAEKDRKKDLKEIPESAFPAPAAMPSIPGAADKLAMEPPPLNVPKDDVKTTPP